MPIHNIRSQEPQGPPHIAMSLVTPQLSLAGEKDSGEVEERRTEERERGQERDVYEKQ